MPSTRCISRRVGTTACFASRDRVTECFRTGAGIEWGDHDPCLFEGTERFFRPGYAANLITSWLPALEGVVAKLESGGLVADVGCGLGASTILMAQAYPRSRFIGFDFHGGSVETARQRAREAGVDGRVQFEVARSTDYPGKGYDLVAHFDSLHDMADPLGAARHVRETLAPKGAWLIVEPFANDRVEQNFNPVGRVFYGEIIFPLEASLRLLTDMVEFTVEKMPRWYPISISGYHIGEAGATPVQQAAFTLSNGFAYVEMFRARGLNVNRFGPRLSFFLDCGLDIEYLALARERKDTVGQEVVSLVGCFGRRKKCSVDGPRQHAGDPARQEPDVAP